MRLALLAPGFSAGEGDWCIPAVSTLVRELSRDHDVTVFALRYPPRRAPYRAFGARVHAFGGAQVTGLGKLALLARGQGSLRREHRAGPFDVLHGLWADEAGFLATTAASAMAVPAVVSLLGGELMGLPEIGYGTQLSVAGRVLVRSALRKATRVTVGSRAMERLAAVRVRPERLHRLPLGVDTRLFHPRGERHAAVGRAGHPRLLHVASLALVKDQATLLRALARVVRRAPGVHLHLVGDGPLRPNLERLAGELGVGDHLTFHGAVDHDRLPEYYRAADIAVLSSRFESQSMVALEAAACGRATVGTAVGLLPELVGTDLTVPVGDVEALAAAILTLAGNAGLPSSLGERCRALVVSRHSLTATVPELTRLYTGLVEESRSRAATRAAAPSGGRS